MTGALSASDLRGCIGFHRKVEVPGDGAIAADKLAYVLLAFAPCLKCGVEFQDCKADVLPSATSAVETHQLMHSGPVDSGA